jgi:hypothetical protein
VTGGKRQASTARRIFILSLATRHLPLLFLLTTFPPMREVHASCVKISRSPGRRQKQRHGFIGILANDTVGIGSAKGFQ